MAYTAGFSVSVGDPTKASDVTTLAANDDFLKTAIDKIMVDSATPTFALVNGVTATTQSSGNNSTKLATTAYADAATISFANDANNRVVTGTGSGLNGEADLTFASNKLIVFGTTGTGAATASVLNLSTRETTVVDADQLGRIEFQAPAETGSDAVLVAASIYAEADVTFDATNNATDLVLATAHDGAAAERVRITSQGEIGLAGANYGTDGQVLTSAGAGAAVAWETIPPGTSLSGTTAHTVATVTGANALEGEANLTFDGTTLAMASSSVAGQILSLTNSGTNSYPTLRFVNDATTWNVYGANGGSGPSPDAFQIENAAGGLFVIQTGGYVGIGQSAPSTYASKTSALVIGGVSASDNNSEIVMLSKTSGNSQLTFIDSATTTPVGRVQYNFNADHMNFMIAGTNRVLFDMQGANPALQIGATRDGNSANVGAMLFGSGQIYGTADGNPILNLNRLSSTGTVAAFRYASTEVGSISVAGSSTAYNTSSDYRLKENVVDLTGATTRVAQLQPHRFNFIVDADTTVDGFVAHEVADIVPEAITGTKDEMRDAQNVIADVDGNIIVENKTEAEWVAGKEPTLVSEATDEEVAVYADPIYAADTVWHSTLTVPEYQGIDQAKLVPLLTAAIQELTARITALESA